MGKLPITIAMNIALFNCAVAAEITPLELLDRYRATRQALSSFVVNSDAVVEILDSGEGNIPYWDRESVELRTDRALFDIVSRRWPHLAVKDAPVAPKEQPTRRGIWDGEKYFSISSFLTSGAGTSYYASISENSERINRQLAIGFTGATLLGIFRGDIRPVDSILRDANSIVLRDSMEKIGGSPCYVIDANTVNGKYAIWIAPEYGYNIAKAEVRKTGSDLVYGESMTAPSKPRPRGLPPNIAAIPVDRIVEFSFSLKNVSFEKIGNIWIPMEANYEHTVNFATGRIFATKTHHKRTNINLDPDFEAIGAFVPDIPNGTPVGIDGIMYIWQDGKVVDSYGHEVNLETLKPPSLVGKALPGLTKFNLIFNPKLVENKMVLVCFWDMEQRPSRNCLMQLSKRAQELKEKDIAVVVIQASKIDKSTLDEWVKEQNIPFVVRMIEAEEEKTRFTWGVKALPWLILTDKEHIVQAEGFGINELDEKITTLREE